MSDKDELRQSLLELHYELLDDDQAARLRSCHRDRSRGRC